MRKRSVYRGVLIVAGLLAAVVIILSHSFIKLEPKKAADTEQSDEKSDKTVIAAPADAVTQASVVKIDEQSPDALLETLSKPEASNKYVPSSEKIFNRLFHVLFRIVIAPNAP
jgi:hypothetical protein